MLAQAPGELRPLACLAACRLRRERPESGREHSHRGGADVSDSHAQHQHIRHRDRTTFCRAFRAACLAAAAEVRTWRRLAANGATPTFTASECCSRGGLVRDDRGVDGSAQGAPPARSREMQK